MEIELINIEMTLEEYNDLTITDLNNLAKLYSGNVQNIILDDKTAKVVIAAPSTWRFNLINQLLLPYRFA
jgi:hypothetical protein